MESNFSENVIEIERHLRRIAVTVRRRGRMSLEEYSITPPQFDALIILNQSGDLTIGDLSNRLYLAYSTTTDLVDRLERASFVVRQRDPDDRRVVRVRVQPLGQQVYEEVLNARRAYLASVLESLDEPVCNNILQVLQLLNARMTDR